MKTKEEIEKKAKELEIRLNKMRDEMVEIGSERVIESDKRYYASKCAELAILHWVLYGI